MNNAGIWLYGPVETATDEQNRRVFDTNVETYMAVLRKDLADAGYDITVCNVQPGPVLTHFEASTPNGTRFSKEENPYPQMQSGREKWKCIMQNCN